MEVTETVIAKTAKEAKRALFEDQTHNLAVAEAETYSKQGFQISEVPLIRA
jgi:hypothetical protein